MAKDYSNALKTHKDSWLSSTTAPEAKKPNKPDKPSNSVVLPEKTADNTAPAFKSNGSKKNNSSTYGLKEGLTRSTVICKIDVADKIKAYAYWERLKINQVYDLIFEDFFKNKDIKPIPTNNKKPEGE